MKPPITKRTIIISWIIFLAGMIIAYFTGHTAESKRITLATYCLMVIISGWGTIQSFRLKADLLYKVLNLGTFLFASLIAYLLSIGFLGAI